MRIDPINSSITSSDIARWIFHQFPNLELGEIGYVVRWCMADPPLPAWAEPCVETAAICAALGGDLEAIRTVLEDALKEVASALPS